ncbi:MAG: carboxymuconolactone decarboxylase family protein [Caulobacterales bacterium]
MTQRLDHSQQSPAFFKKFLEFSMAAQDSSIELAIRDLVNLRVSQINGCGFCVDMHVKEATLHQERPLRMHHVAIWRESPLFSARERACLEWAETLTKLPEHGVSDEIYAHVREELSEQEISDLTYAVIAINGWNRASIAFKTTPGSRDVAYGISKSGLS